MSTEMFRELVKNNDAFAESHPPSPSFAQFPNMKAPMVVTCMDPRCNPNEFWKFSEEGPAVIRNAGGRVTEDTLRSIRVLSGIMSNGRNTVGAVAVVHHRDCGLLNFSNEKVKEQLKIKAELNEQRAKEVDRMEFGSFSEAASLEESVKEDMRIIRNDPYLPKALEVLGYTYDVFSGKTTEVAVM